ncbi:piggyBac transposable element-derived protein 3-like [Gordionus sp. m RMFG-2023]|uniref:piggyBac transposable element-derived protein 3-like n=1 Tax=Gordionus sp. m RMFG-2023 TaxID=3053472 RepID=UPI0031FCD7DE
MHLDMTTLIPEGDISEADIEGSDEEDNYYSLLADDLPTSSYITNQLGLDVEDIIEDTSIIKIKDNPMWSKKDIGNMNTEYIPILEIPEEDSTPLTYFRKFFDNQIISNFVSETNNYSFKCSGKSINTDSDEIEKFIGLHLYTSIVKMPSIRQYWSVETSIPQIAETMSRNRFLLIREFFHVNNNKDMVAREDKGYNKFKIQPFIFQLKQNFKKIKLEEKLAIDEFIIPFKGRSILRQYIKSEPHKWGIKVFALCDSSGYMYDFEIYQGKSTNIINYVWGYLVSGTIRSNRLSGCTLKNDKALKKEGRGAIDYKSEKNGIIICKWQDNKAVTTISNFIGVLPTTKVKRWSVSDKVLINVEMPAIIKNYNEGMGGVDLHDMLVELYRTDIKWKRYYMRMVFHLLDSCVIAKGLMLAGKDNTKKTGRPSSIDVKKEKLSTLPPYRI